MEKTSINCPKCGSTIDVNAIVYNQLHDKLTAEFKLQIETDRKDLEMKAQSLANEKAELSKKKADLQETIVAGVEKRIASERSKLEKQIRDRISDEKSEELKSYQEQLEAKTKEVKDLNRLKAEYQRLERDKNELQEKLEFEAEQRITNAIEQEKARIRKSEEEKNELRIAEKEHIIQQLRVQLSEASKKAEQGSGQLRGEVLETSLEDYLRQCFPADEIEEIKKGVKGADCLHHVRNLYQENCGTVYYETKRTKEFQGSWIGKFKTDMRERNADIGVIVTEEYPKGIDRMTMVEGVWVCSFAEAKGLCFVLRETLLMVQDSKTAQSNKAGKMEILYEYMVSNEFRMQIEAIVEGFSSMHSSLNKERRAMEAIWKQRQKELEKVILNTTHIYSTIRAIAGNAVKPIQELELNAGIDAGVPIGYDENLLPVNNTKKGKK